MEKQKRRPGGGRKPIGEFSGKSATLTTRLMPTTRAALEREAKRAKRSLSQEVERRLVDSLEKPIKQRAFGTGHARALALLVAKLAGGIEASTGKTWREDRYTAAAISTAIATMLARLSPGGELRVPPVLLEMMRQSGAEDLRRPETLAYSFAFGLLEQLRMLRHAPSPSAGSRFQYSDEVYQLPEVAKDLGLSEDELSHATRAAEAPPSRRRRARP
jgi:hypothetical protein